MHTSPKSASHGSQDQVAESLHRMYEEHAAAVRSYALRFTSDAHADDIVQETFIRAWRHLAQLDDGERPVRPWLLRVARNLLTDAVRSERSRPVTPLGDEVPTVAVDGGLDQVLDQQVLLPALRCLPPGQRVVLVEAVLYGASVDSVAQRLGIPAGTARSRLFYGLRTLRRELDPQPAAS
jgi:RNA polymerase sigma-70 factor (ECF subfamily)